MVRTKRRKPVLARKLCQIRMAMGLSQNEMIRTMNMEDSLLREEVSDFERNKRIPSLEVVLAYARAAGVSVEVLIDDDLKLSVKVPVRTKETTGLKSRRA